MTSASNVALRIVRLRTTPWLFIPGALLHFNLPFAYLIKTVILILVLLIIPHIYIRSPCEAAFASNLVEVLQRNYQDYNANAWRIRLHEIRVLFQNLDTWKAVVVFLIKLYVWEKGLVITKEDIRFNQPVLYRVLTHPATDCKIGMTGEQERDFMLWEMRECHIFKSRRDFSTSIYVPAVTNAEGTERRCLQRSGARRIGRVFSTNDVYPGPTSSYKHPMDELLLGCNHARVDCNYLVSARTTNGTTWVVLKSPSKSMVIHMGGNQRPGLTCIRESSLAAQTGVDDVNITRIALGVENAMSVSSCFVKSRRVRTGPRYPHLVVNLCSLLILVCFEMVLFRSSYFSEDDVAKPTFHDYMEIPIDG